MWKTIQQGRYGRRKLLACHWGIAVLLSQLFATRGQQIEWVPVKDCRTRTGQGENWNKRSEVYVTQRFILRHWFLIYDRINKSM